MNMHKAIRLHKITGELEALLDPKQIRESIVDKPTRLAYMDKINRLDQQFQEVYATLPQEVCNAQ